MPVDQFQTYYKSMDIIKARESLEMLKLFDYPNLKEKGRDKIFNSLKDRAFPNEKKVLSMDQLMQKLKDK